jgi:DNA processing protein
LAPRSPKAGRDPAAHTTKLNHRQRLAWLRLIRSENVGPATFRALVNQFGGAEAALDALPALSRRGGRAQSIRVYGVAEAEAELAAAADAGATLVAMGEEGYPSALAHVDAPPPLLYAKGRFQLAEGSIVAMVGARNGSAVGQKLTRQLATELGLEGFVIASGLARGIDTAAHTAALERGTSPCSPAASTSSIPPRMQSCNVPSANRACCSPSGAQASAHAARTSRGAIV